MIPVLLPGLIPASPDDTAPPVSDTLPPGQLYDISIGGIGFIYYFDEDRPNVRETVSPEKDRIDNAANAGEQTLSQWWLRSQQSFHGGAGQVYLEPAIKGDFDDVRFALSKNVDVFTPGQVTRLPDTVSVSDEAADLLVAVAMADGSDALVYVVGGTAKLLTDLDGTPSADAFSDVTDDVISLATDGTNVYAATSTDVYKLTTADVSTSVTLVTYAATATDAVISWQKSRLMLGVNGAVYEIDVTTSGVTLDGTSTTGLRYQHPAVGFHWRCFGSSPAAVLAGGDAGGISTITQFTLDSSSGVPILAVQGDIAALPPGERVISMLGTQGTFLAIGTTKGVRIGTFDTYIGTLSYGPLELLPTDPIIPATALLARDRFVYAAGMAYDEGGLLRVDLGTQIDQSGRFAWAPDLICPDASDDPAVAADTLASDGRIAFAIPTAGIFLESDTSAGREAWVRTSKIRFDTIEPKLFKFGRVRGGFVSGTVTVIVTTPMGTFPGTTTGFTTGDPPEFRLPGGTAEWLYLQIDLEGASTQLDSYQIKALPGTPRDRHFQVQVGVFDRITFRNNQSRIDTLSARAKLSQLEAFDRSGDELIVQEFTPTGIVSTRCVIERMTFTQTERPTATSDIGGVAAILLRTVES